MTENPRQGAIADNPAHAFERLRQEISLLHSAVQGLSAARETIPDYSAALGQMNKQLGGALEGIERIAQAPAVKLTPAEMVRELSRAAIDARAEDKRQIDEARSTLDQSIGRIAGLAERSRLTQRQRKREMWVGGCAFIAGVLLWSYLPGTIARALPETWHVPEWMAARTLNMEQAMAGERLIATAPKTE